MRVLLPYASWLPGAAQDLPLPELQNLLSKMQLLRQELCEKPHFFYLKHELELAYHYGLAGSDQGQLPLAALRRWRASLAPAAGQAWGRLSLCHWQIGMNDGQLRHPAQLEISAEEAQSLWLTLGPLLAERGLELEAYPLLPPYARDVQISGVLAQLPCASLGRVAGADISAYLPRQMQSADLAAPAVAARQWQSLLAEVQMLLYHHPVNNAREARRQPTINSLWLDGVGAWPAGFAAPALLTVLPDLQHAAERGDVASWRAAWQQIERVWVPQWQQALASEEGLHLILCGLHSSASFGPRSDSWPSRLTQSVKNWLRPQPAVHWPEVLSQEL